LEVYIASWLKVLGPSWYWSDTGAGLYWWVTSNVVNQNHKEGKGNGDRTQPAPRLMTMESWDTSMHISPS